MNEIDAWNGCVPEQARARIERDYYARINAQATLEHLMHDPVFVRNPAHHPALFADHGVVHMRDVTRQVLRVFEITHGMLLSPRSEERAAFMRCHGVLMACLHDIGMVDLTEMGRAMHPEVAAQSAFSPALDALFDDLLATHGDVVRRLDKLAARGALRVPVPVALRELAAMAVAHSKAKVPAGMLAEPARLRHAMTEFVSGDLTMQHLQARVRKAERALATVNQTSAEVGELTRLEHALISAQTELSTLLAARGARSGPQVAWLARFYQDARRDAFDWLTTIPDLADDVIDMLRVLRAADAMRQRGTTLKTSGGYEIFVDRTTADVVYALRRADQLFLLSGGNLLAAGEANVAGSELTRKGHLRISFHRGAFATDATTRRAAYCAALAVNDVVLDVVESFAPPAGHDMQVQLEEVDDNLAFSAMVGAQLRELNPGVADRLRIVPSLSRMADAERDRYLASGPFVGDLMARREILANAGYAGLDTRSIDPDAAFEHVHVMTLQPDEQLIAAGDPPGFVYIPMGEGLVVLPLGGYAPVVATAWIPVGITGVIRGGHRNATVVAESTVTLLAMPGEVYMRHWHRPLDATNLVEKLARLG